MIAVFTRWMPSAFCVEMKFVSVAFIVVYILAIVCGVSGFYDGKRSALVQNNNEVLPHEARKKHKEKFPIFILMSALMMKAVILPLALKAMTVMSGIAVVLSTMSLIVSSIVGFSKLAWSSTHPILKVVHVNEATGAKDDDVVGYTWASGQYPGGLDDSGILQPERHVHHYQK